MTETLRNMIIAVDMLIRCMAIGFLIKQAIDKKMAPASYVLAGIMSLGLLLQLRPLI